MPLDVTVRCTPDDTNGWPSSFGIALLATQNLLGGCSDIDAASTAVTVDPLPLLTVQQVGLAQVCPSEDTVTISFEVFNADSGAQDDFTVDLELLDVTGVDCSLSDTTVTISGGECALGDVAALQHALQRATAAIASQKLHRRDPQSERPMCITPPWHAVG